MTDEPVSVDLGWLGRTWFRGALGYGLDGFLHVSVSAVYVLAISFSSLESICSR